MDQKKILSYSAILISFVNIILLLVFSINIIGKLKEYEIDNPLITFISLEGFSLILTLMTIGCVALMFLTKGENSFLLVFPILISIVYLVRHIIFTTVDEALFVNYYAFLNIDFPLINLVHIFNLIYSIACIVTSFLSTKSNNA